MLILVWTTLFVTLLPYFYARTEYRLLSYIIAATLLIWTTSIVMLEAQKGRLISRVIYLAQKSPHFLLYTTFILFTQAILMLTSQIDIRDFIWGLGYFIISLFSYFAFPVLLASDKAFRSMLLFAIFVAVFSSSIAIYVALTGVTNVGIFHIRQVQPYTPLGIYTTSSIFFEANRFALSAFFGLMGSLYLLKDRRYIFFVTVSLFLCLAGIIISWSRAVYLGSVLGFFVWLILGTKPSRRKRVFILLGILTILGLFMITYVKPINEALFALGMGRRAIFWPAAIQIITKQPLLGYGFGNPEIVESALYEYTGIATSIHNTLLSIAFHAGIPAAVLYLIVLYVSLKRLVKSKLELSKKSVILGCTLGSIIAAFFLDYTPGGISYGTFMSTIFLGLSNASPWLSRNFLKPAMEGTYASKK